MTKRTIEEELRESKVYLSVTVGDSMEPMLRNRQDVIVITEAAFQLEKYDVPLYKRPGGKYVLHRILKVEKDHYVICGDNRYGRERVPFEWVIGKLEGFYRSGKYVSVRNPFYRLYVHTWCDFFYIRAILLKWSSWSKKMRIKKNEKYVQK